MNRIALTSSQKPETNLWSASVLILCQLCSKQASVYVCEFKCMQRMNESQHGFFPLFCFTSQNCRPLISRSDSSSARAREECVRVHSYVLYSNVQYAFTYTESAGQHYQTFDFCRWWKENSWIPFQFIHIITVPLLCFLHFCFIFISFPILPKASGMVRTTKILFIPPNRWKMGQM